MLSGIAATYCVIPALITKFAGASHLMFGREARTYFEGRQRSKI